MHIFLKKNLYIFLHTWFRALWDRYKADGLISVRSKISLAVPMIRIGPLISQIGTTQNPEIIIPKFHYLENYPSNFNIPEIYYPAITIVYDSCEFSEFLFLFLFLIERQE